MGSLKLPKFPARDLKRALQQAASVRAFLGPPREYCQRSFRRNLYNPHSRYCRVSPGNRRRLQRRRALRRVRRLPRRRVSHSYGGGQHRATVRSTTEVMHGTAEGQPCSCHCWDARGASAAPATPRPVGSIYVHLHRRTHAHTHPLTHAHTSTHARTRRHRRPLHGRSIRE